MSFSIRLRNVLPEYSGFASCEDTRLAAQPATSGSTSSAAQITRRVGRVGEWGNGA